MTAAIYSLSAALVAALATRAWLLDRDDRARRAFLGLGWSLAVAYLAFALSFLPHLDPLRGLWTGAGVLAPAFLWRCVDAMFPPARAGGLGERLLPAAIVVGTTTAVLHAVLWGDIPRTSPAEAVAGTFGFVSTLVVVDRLRAAREHAVLPSVETRLAWLLALVVCGVALSLAEWAVRTTQPVIDPATLDFFDRGLALQGPLPPVSTLLAAAVVYLLHHALQTHRLVALQEMAARLIVVIGAAAVLVVAYAVTVRWVALTRFPLHSSYLLLLVSSMFLSVFEVARRPVQRRVNRWFHRAGQELEDSVGLLLRELPRRTDADRLAADCVDRLFASGRFAGVGVWTLEPARGSYRLAAHLGMERVPQDVGGVPCPEPLDQGLTAYEARDCAFCTRLRSDLLLPFRDEEDPSVVHGWLALRDSPWSDGFSREERQRLRAVADAAAQALVNIDSFRRTAEERRLAGLGVMSAGLAHEIRNPLAGLKGAAQVLEGEDVSGDAREMIDVILRESDRLDQVVSSFLTFARPVHLARTPVDVTELVRHTTRLLRAEGLPAGVTVTTTGDDVPALVLGDEARLGQVLVNLLRNARDAIGDAGEIEVAVAEVRHQVEIAVRDTGPGVPPEVAEQVFTPFFTTKPSGTGLGLAISRGLIESHGGTLELRSRTGEGAAFVIRLPAAPPDDDAPDDDDDEQLDADQSTGPELARASLVRAGSGPAPGTNRLSS